MVDLKRGVVTINFLLSLSLFFYHYTERNRYVHAIIFHRRVKLRLILNYKFLVIGKCEQIDKNIANFPDA